MQTVDLIVANIDWLITVDSGRRIIRDAAIAVDGGKITHPLAVNRMLRGVAGNLAVEKGFSYPEMLGTQWSMRHLRTSNTTFLTVPVAANPLATQGGNDYVLLDDQADAKLWAALREDRLAEYLTLNDDADVLGGR